MKISLKEKSFELGLKEVTLVYWYDAGSILCARTCMDVGLVKANMEKNKGR